MGYSHQGEAALPLPIRWGEVRGEGLRCVAYPAAALATLPA